MPLLLLSLDDTLLDRAAAFTDWARDFLEQIDAPRYDLDWLLAIDADGMTSRWDVAEAIRQRYGLSTPAIEIIEEQRTVILDRLRPNPLVTCALRIAIDAGLVPVVVTNGETGQQYEKLRRSGLDRYLADCVVSEEAGVRKPNPRIFAIAAQRVRLRLQEAWLIGDSPEADISGAAAIGIESVWLHRGRQWPEAPYAPTCVADGVIAGIAAVLANCTPTRRAPRQPAGPPPGAPHSSPPYAGAPHSGPPYAGAPHSSPPYAGPPHSGTPHAGPRSGPPAGPRFPQPRSPLDTPVRR